MKSFKEYMTVSESDMSKEKFELAAIKKMSELVGSSEQDIKKLISQSSNSKKMFNMLVDNMYNEFLARKEKNKA